VYQLGATHAKGRRSNPVYRMSPIKNWIVYGLRSPSSFVRGRLEFCHRLATPFVPVRAAFAILPMDQIYGGFANLFLQWIPLYLNWKIPNLFWKETCHSRPLLQVL